MKKIIIPKKFSNILSGMVLISIIIITLSCSDQNAEGGQFSMPPMPVEAANVIEQKMSDKFKAVGTIEAIEEVTIVSEIDGMIIEIPFEEGSYVQRGQIITKLDDAQLGAELLRAEAFFTQFQTSYNRIKTVVEQKAGTQQDLDDAFASLKVAEANYKLAQTRFDKTKIVAPFDGQIGSRKVSIGTFLRAGDPIAELANLNEVRVNFSAPEKYLAQLKRGAEVTVSSNVYQGHEVKGRIIAIEPVLDSETRTAQITARMRNPGQKFRSGMSADISVVLGERMKALTIPNESVFASGNQSFVFVINPDSSVKRVPVSLGLQLANVVEILSGLELGMQVVNAGHQKLFDGAKVIPILKTEIDTTQSQ